MFGRLLPPSLVSRDDKQYGGRGPETGQHVADEPLVSRYIDEGEQLVGGPAGQGRPRVAEIDRHAPPAFFGPAVRLHPGQRPDQRRLSVVDVAGRGDDVHFSVTVPRGRLGSLWPTGCRRLAGRSVRRSGTGRVQSGPPRLADRSEAERHTLPAARPPSPAASGPAPRLRLLPRPLRRPRRLP